jgi:hypothetical protein
MIWHYTVDRNFCSILTEGLIRPATARVPPGERPIVWFSTEQYWEPTVTKGWLQTDGTIKDLKMGDFLEREIQLFRIGVDPATAPYRWCDLKSLSGMSSEAAHGLARMAKALGANPSRWRGTFDAVSDAWWEAIERFEGGGWVSCANRVDTPAVGLPKASIT